MQKKASITNARWLKLTPNQRTAIDAQIEATRADILHVRASVEALAV